MKEKGKLGSALSLQPCFSISSVCHFVLSKQHVAMGTMTSVGPHDIILDSQKTRGVGADFEWSVISVRLLWLIYLECSKSVGSFKLHLLPPIWLEGIAYNYVHFISASPLSARMDWTDAVRAFSVTQTR